MRRWLCAIGPSLIVTPKRYGRFRPACVAANCRNIAISLIDPSRTILDECNRLVTTVVGKQQKTSQQFSLRSLQPRVLRLGLLQDGDVGVGIFPEGEEVFVGSERADAGGICIRSVCVSTSKHCHALRLDAPTLLSTVPRTEPVRINRAPLLVQLGRRQSPCCIGSPRNQHVAAA